MLYKNNCLVVCYEIQSLWQDLKRGDEIPSVTEFVGGKQNVEDKNIYPSVCIITICNIYKQI